MTDADGGADVAFPTERAEAIVACSPHGIVEADPRTGAITWANPAMHAMVGRSPGTLVGSAFAVLHPPEAIDVVAGVFARMAAGDLRPATAVPCRRADGSLFFCDIHPGSVAEIPDPRLVAFFTEVTGRHLLQQQLLGAEELSRQGSWELDHATGSLFWSPEMHRLLGHDEAEPPPGVPWVLERIHPGDQEWVERIFEGSLEAGEPYEVEHRMELDRRTIWVRATGEHVLDQMGKPLRSRGTLRDVTAERERAQRARITDMLTTLGSITGDLSAEIDNLLSVIANAVELLRDDIVDSPETDELVGLINEACRRGHLLARRLVTLSGQRTIGVADVEVNAQLESIEPLLRSVTGSLARLRIEVSDQPLLARADPEGLAMSIINLVSNSRNAMSGRGGGEVVVKAASVRVGEPGRGRVDAAEVGDPADLPAGPYVRIDVTDDGHGLSEELIEQVFNSFWTSKTDGRGTGLGLPMVQDFVVRCGGAITMRSTIDVGAIVSLWLPESSADPSIARVPHR